MSHIDESLIRDGDLREQLETARGSPTFRSVVSFLAESQRRRDQAEVAKTARAAKLAAMPREKRRRLEAFEVIDSDATNPNNLRFMPTPLAICGLPYKALPPTGWNSSASKAAWP